MAPGSQGFFGVPASKANCGHVSGLVARREAAGPDGFRGIEALIKPAGSRCPLTRDRYPATRRLTDDAGRAADRQAPARALGVPVPAGPQATCRPVEEA